MRKKGSRLRTPPPRGSQEIAGRWGVSRAYTHRPGHRHTCQTGAPPRQRLRPDTDLLDPAEESEDPARQPGGGGGVSTRERCPRPT